MVPQEKINADTIILASASPRRKELMELITPDFAVVPSGADEHIEEKLEPGEYCEKLACIKALEVAQRYPDNTVIGADTIVAVGDQILGKPRDEIEAKFMLTYLSGRVHSVYTGVMIKKGRRSISFYEKTDVEFLPLTDREIDDYVATGDPLDKAGAYGIQGKAALFVKGIVGDYNNVVGLPAARIAQTLKML